MFRLKNAQNHNPHNRVFTSRGQDNLYFLYSNGSVGCCNEVEMDWIDYVDRDIMNEDPYILGLVSAYYEDTRPIIGPFGIRLNAREREIAESTIRRYCDGKVPIGRLMWDIWDEDGEHDEWGPDLYFKGQTFGDYFEWLRPYVIRYVPRAAVEAFANGDAKEMAKWQKQIDKWMEEY